MIKWSLIHLVICLCSIHIPLAHILPINSELFSRGQLSKTFTSEAVVSESENQYLHFLVNNTSNIQLPFDSITSQWTFLAQELHPCLLSSSSLRITPPLPPQQGDSSECMQQDGRKKAKRLCVTNVRGLLLACFVMIFNLHLCFLVFYKKICLKESEVWQKVISNKIIVVNACHTRFPVLLHKFTWLNKNQLIL